MKITLLLFLFFSFHSFSASLCECFPNIASKQYIEINRGWWRSKITYTCNYDCTSEHGRTETVTGLHTVKFYGDEKGNEVVCAGTVYIEKYDALRGWFFWDYDHSEKFSPKKAKSVTLNAWAKENCL